MDKIISTLTIDDLLIQLAEEAAELAQAAAKYYRATHARNPTPVSLMDARDALAEEIADVNVAVSVLQWKIGIPCEEIDEIEAAKIKRWKERIENGV